MLAKLLNKESSIGIVGLGYVGLPLGLALARHFRVRGFDINVIRVAALSNALDATDSVEQDDFADCDISFSADPQSLKDCSFYIVTVPTDITEAKTPDLRPLQEASRLLGGLIDRGDCIVYESTVYPGCTEEICLPLVEEVSGLVRNESFQFGYSPERVSPGDSARTVGKIVKVVSGGDASSLELIDTVYSKVILAGTFRAESVKVAEAAKVIENTQRDLQISLMNELAILFDRIGIDTSAVLAAASTKWNFAPFQPGLVGGHCIGVDPYYLLHKAREVDIEPEVIAAGRRVNDRMPAWIAKKVIIGLSLTLRSPAECRALILGVTFKPDVRDTRNSKVVELARELKEFGLEVDLSDSYADATRFEADYQLPLIEASGRYDVIVLAVPHQRYVALSSEEVNALLQPQALIFDLKGAWNWAREAFGDRYWRL